MTYVTLLDQGTRRARKSHQCFDCYRTIPAGEEYHFSTCKYDHVYTLCQHKDCRAASEFYRKVHRIDDWGFDDGIPPLADMVSDLGELTLDMATLRGHFPHVVCRIELGDQLAGIRFGDDQYS